MVEEVYKYLRRLHPLKARVESLTLETQFLEERANSIPMPSWDQPRIDRTPSLKAPFIAYIDKLDKMHEKLNQAISDMVKVETEITDTIRKLDNPTFETILIERYIMEKTWKEISKDLHYSLARIYELHRAALIELKKHIK